MNTWLKRGLLAAAAFQLFAPEVVPDFDAPQEPPLELPGRTVYVDGIELFVRETGPPDAPTIVLVHGWGDESLVVFPRIVPLLAEDFHLVLVDNRNNGKSDHVRGTYGIADVATELDGVLGELGVTDATVFGFSMGGLIAQELGPQPPAPGRATGPVGNRGRRAAPGNGAQAGRSRGRGPGACRGPPVTHGTLVAAHQLPRVGRRGGSRTCALGLRRLPEPGSGAVLGVGLRDRPLRLASMGR